MQKYFLAVPDPDIEIRGVPDHYIYMFFFYLESSTIIYMMSLYTLYYYIIKPLEL